MKISDTFEFINGDYVLREDFTEDQWYFLVDYLCEKFKGKWVAPLALDARDKVKDSKVIGFVRAQGVICFGTFKHHNLDKVRKLPKDVFDLAERKKDFQEGIDLRRAEKLVRDKTPYELANMYIEMQNRHNALSKTHTKLVQSVEEAKKVLGG